MEFLIALFKDLPHLLATLGNNYGPGLYLILFAIIFAETGFVVAPILPGDSLLFAVGALLPQMPSLNIYWMLLILIVAAVAGDFLNYHIGKWLAPKIEKQSFRWLNKNHLLKTENFFKKHGGKTIILARFMPIVRTYAPFVAGISNMNYGYFFSYNVIGAIAWVSSFLMLGHFFGNIPSIKSNFQIVVIGVVFVSLLPIAIELFKSRQALKKS